MPKAKADKDCPGTNMSQACGTEDFEQGDLAMVAN